MLRLPGPLECVKKRYFFEKPAQKCIFSRKKPEKSHCIPPIYPSVLRPSAKSAASFVHSAHKHGSFFLTNYRGFPLSCIWTNPKTSCTKRTCCSLPNFSEDWRLFAGILLRDGPSKCQMPCSARVLAVFRALFHNFLPIRIWPVIPAFRTNGRIPSLFPDRFCPYLAYLHGGYGFSKKVLKFAF